MPGKTASTSELGRVGDMGPPPLPVNAGASAASKRRLHRSASNISNRSSKSSRSIPTSNRSTSNSHKNRNGSVSTTKEEAEEKEKSEERQQGITAGSSPFLPFSTGDSTGSEEPFSTPLHLSTSDNDAALENFSSSPTVAALTRNPSRGASALGPAFVPTHRSKEPEQQPSSEEEEIGIQRKSSAKSLPREEGAAVKSSSASTLSARIQASSSSSYGASHRKRPKFLKSSQSSSQRSSISSMTDMHLDLNPDMDHDGASTITAGDVGGGGALSRSTSLGSIASGITGIAGGSIYGDKNNGVSMSAAEKALARLDEEERNSRRGSVVDDKETGKGLQEKEDYKEPTTPTDQKPPLEPTDTIITAHVKSIHIPATVTREYHSRHLGGMTPGSPSKRAGAAPVLPQGKNMTLKEQSAIIDRLQKENFDLKIKVFYLNEKLEKQSDEGIKEMTKENVEMKVKLAEGMRERKSLKRRLKELEKKVENMGGEKEGREDGEDGDIWELKERVERYEIEIEELTRREREREERLRNDIGGKGEPVRAEDVEMLREFLETETARREQVDLENRRLREELWRLRNEPNNSHLSGSTRQNSVRGGSEPREDSSLMSQLRYENDELRREVGAQTSMLTSRNREKERLYQEIEDLKLHMRNGGISSAMGMSDRGMMSDNRSVIGSTILGSDRILERSISRAGTASATGTHATNLSESERDDYENVNGELRDRISELRLNNQELKLQLDDCYRVLHQREEEAKQLEAEYAEDLEVAQAEVQEMQAERNEALRMHEEIGLDFEQLKEEAEEEIQRLEEEMVIRVNELNHELNRVEEEARMKDEDFRGLQVEMRNVSETVVRLEDAQEEHAGEIQRLEQKIEELERTIQENEEEMNALENTLREANEKIEMMTVQSESAKGEIAFLREEQDADKIKIGELQNIIKSMKKEVEDERERFKETQEQLEVERHERESTGDQRHQEWEKKLNEKNNEVMTVKEEVRRLRGKVSTREEEAKQWKEKLDDLEKALREAMGDLPGNHSGILQSIVNMQSELESTLEELEYTKGLLGEKDRMLKDREHLLETMALESRKLSDMLDKEKSGRKTDRATIDTLQTNHQQSRQRLSQHQTQYTDLEKARSKDNRTIQQLEHQYREQLAERNNLLIQVWQRLSTLCGPDWTQRNSVVETTTGPGGVTGKQSMETAVVGALQGFQKNMIFGVKTIESIVAGFKTRCRGVERDLWKEYQVVENALESRTRRLERLENLIRGGIGEQSGMRTEVAKLRTENRLLKAEINVMKNEQVAAQQTSPLHRSKTVTSSSSNTIVASTPTERKQRHRHHREKDGDSKSDALNERQETALVAPHTPGAMARTASTASVPVSTDSTDVSEKRWILRLRELEKRLKAEREARLLDRSAAKKKVEEARGQREEMKAELERERVSKIGS